jgi:muramidase (phage lysozyme)
MAEQQFKTRQEAQAKLVTAIQDNSRKLRKAYDDNDQAAIDKYSKEYDRLTGQLRASTGIGNIGAGVASTAVGMLTGIPDIGIAAYNYFAKPQQPVQTLRERLLSAANLPSEAVAKEDQLTYSSPDIATGAVGIYQLGKLGFQGVKGWLQGRQTKELLSKLSPEEQNFFKDLMVKGQGSPNTEVTAQIAKLQQDPKYAELFNTLNRAASERATAGIAPAASRISEEQAGVGAAAAVQNRIQGLAESRKLAGDSAFTRAFGYAEGKQLVDPKNTLKNIDGLIAEYSKKSTPNAERAVEVLTAMREKFQPTITTQGSKATQYVVRAGAEAKTIPGQNVNRVRQVVEYDSLGLPITRTVSEAGRTPSISIPARSDVTGTIPGAKPFTTQGGVRQLTAEEVQGVLSEFGKKATQGDSLIKDLAISDEQRISAAIFGGMKDDLSVAFKEAAGADRTALGFLIKARKEIADASTKYNDAIAQGLPAFLKDKSIAQISFEDLYSQYKAATPAQRATFRTHIENTEPEALKNFDGRVWQDFSGKYATTLSDGMPGTDLARMAQDWAKMAPQEKDAIASALGQKLSDFDGRMKDALVFTRRAATGQPQTEGSTVQQLTREASAVVGASPAGYQGAKITQLIGDAFGLFTKGGISNELAMKTLLTPEGAQFLKTAKLSPGSQKTLEALTAVQQAPLKLPTFMAMGTAMSPNQQAMDQQGTSGEFQWVDPDQGDASNPNVRKFLDEIAKAEGGDYNIIVGGGRFEDFSKHPGIVGMVTDKGPSTAAGRYQITQSTYNDLAKKMGISGFDPTAQDAMAIQLLKDRGAYEDVLSGNFDAAKKTLRSTWDAFNKGSQEPAFKWVDPDAQ